MSLKAIANLVKTAKYDEAEKEIQAIEKAGNGTLNLFLLGMKVATEMDKFNTAIHYLNKAKELDPNNSEIIRAECAIYEKFPENFTKDQIHIFDKVINDEKTSNEKKQRLQKIKWIALIRLRLFAEFRQPKDYLEALKDPDVCIFIMEKSLSEKKIPIDIVQSAFLNCKDKFSQKEHLHGTLLFFNDRRFDDFALEHTCRFGCKNSEISNSVFSKIAIELIQFDKMPIVLSEAVKMEGFVESGKPMTDWISHLFAFEIAQAYDSLSKLSPDDYHTWPYSGLAFYTFLKTHQFAKVLKVYRSNLSNFPDLEIFKILEIEAVFESCGDKSELKQLLRMIENSNFPQNKKVTEIQLRAKNLLGKTNENEIQSSDLSPEIKSELLAEFYFASKNYPNAQRFAQQCLEQIENASNKFWRAPLILAKLKWIVEEEFDEAENDLRNLYSQNPFVADILASMAEFYIAVEELESAKQLINHAILLNPSNRDFRELQDKIYELLELSIEERIQNLNQYIILKPYSMWAVRHVTVLEIQSGRFEEAINKLRRVIHALPDDVDIEVRKSAADIWAYVGLVNFHRGQAKSAMYAFEAAVSFEPENPSFLLQLALTQKSLYKFEEVFQTLKKLRSIQTSPQIHKHGNLVFIESVSLFAAHLIPGKAQLRQLLIFFKIVGSMKISEWYSSRVLSLSIANALALLRKYNNNIIVAFLSETSEFSKKCGISKKEEILNIEIALMLNLLSTEQNIGIINETGVRILAYAIEKKSSNLAEIARRFFRKAILLPGQNSFDRSIIYVNLGFTFCVGTEKKYDKALHCFLRSLQLDKHNPSALSNIGFIGLKTNNIEDSIQAFNAAHILEPLQVEHWCGRGILGELKENSNITEIMNNFQHSLSIKPCLLAVEAFAYYLVKAKSLNQSQNKFDFDFTSIKHLLHVNEHSDELMYSMAIFAEHFRHFDAAAYLIDKASVQLNVLEDTKMRIQTASHSLISNASSKNGLQRLIKIFHGSLPEAIIASGPKPILLIKYLLHSIAYDEWITFWKFFRARFYPLLVGFVNVLEMDSYWSRGIIATLRTNRPPHALLEVFPLKTPKHDFASTSRPREDENAFKKFDPAVDPLYKLLALEKAENNLNKANSGSNEDMFLILPPQIQEVENDENENED